MKNKSINLCLVLLRMTRILLLEGFFILTRKSNYFELKIIENVVIASDKPVLNIICFPSIWLCVYSCRLFISQYHVTDFSILSKQNLQAFNMNLDVTIKEAPFGSWSWTNGFVENFLIIFFINLALWPSNQIHQSTVSNVFLQSL